MSASSTTYEAFIATHTYTPRSDEADGEVTKTYVLPPQTTPHTRGVDPAVCETPNVYCDFDIASTTSGTTCGAYDVVNQHGFRNEPDCYPDGYWDRNWPHHFSFAGDSTLAYPGDACPTAWTPACTVTLTLNDLREQRQTWCCPVEGDWSCGSSNPSSTRLCERQLTTSTSLWYSTSDAEEGAQTVQTSAELNVLLQRPVFPLGNFDGTAEAAATSSSSSSTADGGEAAEGSAGDESDSSASGLSTGQVAGIAVGISVAAILLLTVLVCLCCRRRKRSRAVKAGAGALPSELQSGPGPHAYGQADGSFGHGYSPDHQGYPPSHQGYTPSNGYAAAPPPSFYTDKQAAVGELDTSPPAVEMSADSRH